MEHSNQDFFESASNISSKDHEDKVLNDYNEVTDINILTDENKLPTDRARNSLEDEKNSDKYETKKTDDFQESSDSDIEDTIGAPSFLLEKPRIYFKTDIKSPLLRTDDAERNEFAQRNVISPDRNLFCEHKNLSAAKMKSNSPRFRFSQSSPFSFPTCSSKKTATEYFLPKDGTTYSNMKKFRPSINSREREDFAPGKSLRYKITNNKTILKHPSRKVRDLANAADDYSVPEKRVKFHMSRHNFSRLKSTAFSSRRGKKMHSSFIREEFNSSSNYSSSVLSDTLPSLSDDESNSSSTSMKNHPKSLGSFPESRKKFRSNGSFRSSISSHAKRNTVSTESTCESCASTTGSRKCCYAQEFSKILQIYFERRISAANKAVINMVNENDISGENLKTRSPDLSPQVAPSDWIEDPFSPKMIRQTFSSRSLGKPRRFEEIRPYTDSEQLLFLRRQDNS